MPKPVVSLLFYTGADVLEKRKLFVNVAKANPMYFTL